MAGITLPRLTTARRTSMRITHWKKNILLTLASLPVLLFLLLPLMALVARVSPVQMLANLVDQEVAQAIWLSLTTSVATMLIAILAGAPLAFLLARRHFPGRTLIDTFIDLPMVLPPSVAGIALLVAFGRRGLLGQYFADFGLSIAFTQIAVILAQVFVAAPYFIRAASAGFAHIDRELEQAAALDGAGAREVFRYITLPLAAHSLAAGAIMTWARALGEFGATIIFAGNFPGRTQTMPLAIYIGFELNLSVALTLSAILLGVSFGVLFVMKRILHERINVA